GGRPDLAAQDLPGRALGQLVDQPDLPRVLVGGDLVAGERAQFLRGRAGVGLERYGRADLLAEVVVRDPDHGHLGHRRVLVQDFLDLARVDVVAAPDDQVLFAVDDVEVAVFVDPGQVPAAEPAVGDRLGGGLGLAQVALHHVGALDDDLADLSLRSRLSLVVDQAHLHALDRNTDRARLTGPVR